MRSVLFLIWNCLFLINALERPIIDTPYGKVRGFYLNSYGGQPFAAYEGIPYAEPPLGELRFEDPQPRKPWPGVLDANFTTLCTQISHSLNPEGGYFIGDEDCLYLNVYTPKETKGKLLDVIVHIHGGGFMFGYSKSYAEPNYIMDKDIVFVTFNYRVGSLGFLSTEDHVVPGNTGMKDQSFALKWIKDNIKHFGGNPDSITITGLSAGGASVHYHYLSPLSKGLFNRGISLSGTALCPWTFQENALEKARQLSAAVGCPVGDNQEMIDCLKTRPAKQIVEVTRQFRVWLFNPFSPFGLVVEKGSKKPFLDEHPYKVLATGKAYDVPWITSVTADEGLYPAADYAVKETYLPYLNKNWNELAPYILDYNFTIPNEVKNKISQAIRKFYLGDKVIARKTFTELVQLMSDRLFVADAEKAAKLQAKMNKSPVYFYYFSYHAEEQGTLATLWTETENVYGVAHGDDVNFIFGKGAKKMTEEDEKIKNILLGIWTSFSKSGKPFVEGVNWPQLDKENLDTLKYLHIKTPQDLEVEETSELGNSKFWNSINFRENEKLFSGSKDEL